MAEPQLAMACGPGDLQDLSLPLSSGRAGNPLYVEGRALGTWDRGRRGPCQLSSCLVPRVRSPRAHRTSWCAKPGDPDSVEAVPVCGAT